MFYPPGVELWALVTINVLYKNLQFELQSVSFSQPEAVNVMHTPNPLSSGKVLSVGSSRTFLLLRSLFTVIVQGQDEVPAGPRCGKRVPGERCALIVIVQEGWRGLLVISSFLLKERENIIWPPKSRLLARCFTLEITQAQWCLVMYHELCQNYSMCMVWWMY